MQSGEATVSQQGAADEVCLKADYSSLLLLCSHSRLTRGLSTLSLARALPQ
jgi:hypothetical protein